MKIAFLDWKCFHKDDTIAALEKMGHEVVKFFHEGYNDDFMLEDYLKAYEEFDRKNHPEAMFSYNYYPVVAECCKKKNIPYISFIYDSPYVLLYSYTLMYPTNHVFLFDSSWVEEFRSGGLKNVHYMVLPGNADRVKAMNRKYYNPQRVKCDVSFVGSLYNEDHNFYERLEKKASDYLLGYLSGIMEAQTKLYGVNIVDKAIKEDIYQEMMKALPAEPAPNLVEPKTYRYSNYFIKRKITQIERIRLLSAIGEKYGNNYDIKLFTIDPNVKIPGIKNMGIAVYETEMPFVFNDSRINLNISLRSINTGIPLRCMDIMSCGGFLLSNYQSDLVTDFVPGEDFDFFGDPDDMLYKIDYYLSHEKERADIAENGREKIREYFSFEAVFTRIFDTVFGEKDV